MNKNDFKEALEHNLEGKTSFARKKESVRCLADKVESTSLWQLEKFLKYTRGKIRTTAL